jgi:hypothetical protein
MHTTTSSGGGGVWGGGGGGGSPTLFHSIYLTEHTECHAFCPVVRIGSPHPLARKRVLPLPPPLVPRRETHSLAAEELGDPIPTKGQTLWYSMYTIIPLRLKLTNLDSAKFQELQIDFFKWVIRSIQYISAGIER